MNVDVLQALEKRREETSTTGLVIWQDGHTVTSWGERKKVPLYSMTKSFVSLAIGFLFDEGKIVSIDTPVSQWFHEWKQDKKSLVTIRMLMTHTSGIMDHFIETDGNFNVEKFNAFKTVPNVIKAAMNLGLVKEPGTHASYSNSSADILVELVNRVSTMRIDAYVNKKLFEPLGITDWEWVSSTKQLFGTDDDTPSGADGLVLSAYDLVKVGKMLLQDGKYADKQILSPQWIKLMSSEIPTNCLTVDLAKAALTNTPDPEHPGKYIEATDNGRKIHFEKYSSALLWMVSQSRDAFMGWGFLGQYFMILPAKKRVAVRLYTEGLPNLAAQEDNTRVSFADFEYWVRRL